MTFAPPAWLSHQTTHNAHRCIRVGTTLVCARCLGTYPVLLVVLAVQLRRPMAAPIVAADPWLLFGLPVPALVDWTAGQLTGWRGSNAVRLATGALLGGGLGRCIYVNMRHPGDVRVFAQLLGLCAVAGIVWGLRQVLRLGGGPGAGGE